MTKRSIWLAAVLIVYAAAIAHEVWRIRAYVEML